MSDALALSDNAIVRRKPTLVAADVADEAILLDVDSGYFFQLNKSASQIWHHAQQPIALSDLCRKMAESFDVDASICRDDVAAFVMDMQERGLLLRDQ